VANNSSSLKRKLVTKCYSGSQSSIVSLEQHGQQKMIMRFGIWNVWSLCRTDSLKTVACELVKYYVGSSGSTRGQMG
jgi:hypothetical protein